jgi:hypothetical protein
VPGATGGWEFVNEMDTGQMILELKSLRCGETHLEIICAPASSAAVGVMPGRVASVVEAGHS